MTIELKRPFEKDSPVTSPVPRPTPEKPNPPPTGHKTIFVFHNATGSQIDDLHLETLPAAADPHTHITEAPKIKDVRVALVDAQGEETRTLDPTPAPTFGDGVHRVDLNFA